MASLGNASVTVPSAVFASADGRLLTGEAAERRLTRQPDRGAREFKRRLGDPTPIMLGGSPFSPTAMLAATLRDVVEIVAALEGAPPDNIVLTRPAVWGPYRLEQFAQVARLAGFDDAHVVTEPHAAATYYVGARGLADGDVIAVYDLGGGTFDSAVLLYEAGETQLLGVPEGVEWLGGADFDAAVLHHVDSELGGAVSAADPDDEHDRAALAQLRRECVLAKEALSFDEETAIPVFLTHGRQEVRLTRARFEELITSPVSATIEGLNRTLRSAGLRPADLTQVVLAGGSSRVPLIARMLESSFGRPVVVDAHPKHVVALGAAQIAAAPLAWSTPRTAAGTATAAMAVPAGGGGALALRSLAAESLSPHDLVPGTGSPAAAPAEPVEPAGLLVVRVSAPGTGDVERVRRGRSAPVRGLRAAGGQTTPQPLVTRRDLYLALAAAAVVLALAALTGTLVGYLTSARTHTQAIRAVTPATPGPAPRPAGGPDSSPAL
jgi:actin-like ATPase involved in cell morphogenesis